MADYLKTFTGNGAFSDSDWTDQKSTFTLIGDELHPTTDGVSAKMVMDGVEVNRSATAISIRIQLGTGFNEFHSVGGPAWLVPAGLSPDHEGKGYWFRHNGNDINLYQIDTGAGIGSSIYHYGSAAWASTDWLEMEISGHNASPENPVIKCFRWGGGSPERTQIGSGHEVTSYIDTGIPGVVADPQWNEDRRRWKAFDFTGTTTGAFTITSVNGGAADTVYHNDAFTIYGTGLDTVATIELTQGTATETVEFTLDSPNSSISCIAIDMHLTAMVDGDAILSFTDNASPTTTKEYAVTFSAANDFDIVTSTEIDTYLGAFRDVADAIPGVAPEIGDVMHGAGKLVGDSPQKDTTWSTDGPYLDASTPSDGNTCTCWHYSVTYAFWTQIDMTFNPAAPDGPYWVSTIDAFNVTAGTADTLDLNDYTTGSTSPEDITAWALDPLATGFSLHATTGVLTYDGTITVPGTIYLYPTATDANGTTRPAGPLPVIITEDTLQLLSADVTGIGQTEALVVVHILNALGSVYASITDDPDDCDTSSEIQDGAGDTAEWYGGKVAALQTSFMASGLTADSTLYYGIVQTDDGEDSNIITGSFSTQAPPTETLLGKSPVRRP